jgi:transcriptional regulator CtsR
MGLNSKSKTINVAISDRDKRGIKKYCQAHSKSCNAFFEDFIHAVMEPSVSETYIKIINNAQAKSLESKEIRLYLSPKLFKKLNMFCEKKQITRAKLIKEYIMHVLNSCDE